MEVLVRRDHGLKSWSGSRLDIVVYNKNRRAVRVIEVKKRGRKLSHSQLRRFEYFRIPVDIVEGPAGVKRYLNMFSINMAPWRSKGQPDLSLALSSC